MLGACAASTLGLASPGIHRSGAVVVSGRQSGNRFVSLTVEAFGRSASLSKEQLAKVHAGFVNGLQVSYEGGYPETGGRTVYLLLSIGFTFGLKESQVISINENGTVKVD